MHDKRVQKGNTYAAMVIPAGSYPDTITGSNAMEQSQNAQISKTQTLKSTNKVSNGFFYFKREAKLWCDNPKNNTLTETSLPLNQSTAVTTHFARPTSLKSGWLTSPKKLRWGLLLNSTLIALQCLFSSLECLPRKTAKRLKSTMVITNCLISIRKLHRCSTSWF